MTALAAGCGPSLTPVAAPNASAAGQSKTPKTPGEALVADGFKVLGQTKGITLYQHAHDVGFEFAAEGNLPAAPERVRRLLLDFPGHTKWQDHLVESRVLQQGPDWLDVYERLGLPVIEDRDYTLHVTWGESAGSELWTKFVAKPDLGPAPVDGVTRVVAHRGAWRLFPIDNGNATHAVYRFYLDLQSDIQTVMGTGQAESGIVDYFAQITRELPNYP